MACPCCWAGALCAVVPLAQKAVETPMGKAACVAALPFFCVAMALAMGAVQFEELTKMASCVAGTTTAVQACGRGPSSRSRWSSTMRDARGTTSIGGYPLIDASVSRGVIDTRTRRT